jgi:hypothetical protein
VRAFAVRIKRPNDVAVQGSQHPDARMHQEVAAFSGHEEHLNGCLPFV